MNSKAADGDSRMKLNRRRFLGGALATAALPAAAIDAAVTAFATENVTEVTHESTFGWVDPETDAITNTYHEIVTAILRNPRNQALMMGNIVSNNTLLSRLQTRLKAKDTKKTFRFDKMHDHYDDDIAKNRERVAVYANQGKVA